MRIRIIAATIPIELWFGIIIIRMIIITLIKYARIPSENRILIHVFGRYLSGAAATMCTAISLRFHYDKSAIHRALRGAIGL